MEPDPIRDDFLYSMERIMKRNIGTVREESACDVCGVTCWSKTVTDGIQEKDELLGWGVEYHITSVVTGNKIHSPRERVARSYLLCASCDKRLDEFFTWKPSFTAPQGDEQKP